MFSMQSKGKSLAKLGLADLGMKAMSPGMINQALKDAGQVIINSTKAGYLAQKSPDGSAWPSNPSWYKEMKGKAATLTGPTKKKISAGIYSGYEFKKINTERMKNALIKIVTASSVTIKYKKTVEERAEKTQLGGESELILNTGGGEIKLEIDIQARPHLGVAENYNRLGDKTDPEHIEEIFGDMIVTIL